MRKVISLLLMVAMTITMSFSTAFMSYADETTDVTGQLERTYKVNKIDDTHITFGMYPQTEIVDTASRCGTYGKTWTQPTDYIVDEKLYDELYSATFDENDDYVASDGCKYRRAKANSSSNSNYYTAKNSTDYHYFKYEPVVWRILEEKNGDLFLLSEIALYCRYYNNSLDSTTWEKCTLRSWLNSNFYNDAFDVKEKILISDTTVINKANPTYGTLGGNTTIDKVFLLSLSDLSGTTATNYHIDSNNDRAAKSSTYAKAIGLIVNSTGSSLWWLRSPGYYGNHAAYVYDDGSVGRDGDYVYSSNKAIRPALHLNLKSIVDDFELSQESYVADGTAKTPTATIEGLEEGVDFEVTYRNNTNPGKAAVTVKGIGEYSGTITKEFSILNKLEGEITVAKDPCFYDGQAQTPTISIPGLEQDKDYEVAYSNNTEIGVATVTVTGIGEYTGTLEKTFQIVERQFANPTYFWNGNKCTAMRQSTNDTSYSETEVATGEYIKDTGAGCTTNETGHYEATFTNKAFRTQYTADNSVEKPNTYLGHDVKKTEAKKATCEATGNSAYYTCQRCGKYFSDAGASNEIKKNSWILDPINHKYGAPTYNWNLSLGTCTAVMTCENDENHVIFETANGLYIKDTDATCLTNETGHFLASFLNAAFVEQSSANDSVSKANTALGHAFGPVDYAWNGNRCTATRVCQNDPTHVESEEVVGKYVIDTQASCKSNEKGHYEATFTNKAFSKATTETNSLEKEYTKLNHSLTKHEANDACTGTGNVEYYSCSKCGQYYADAAATQPIEKDSWVIAQTGHDYGTATYKWNGNKCTASRICKYNSNHIDSETVIATYVMDNEATCEDNETGHYEATFTNKAFRKQFTDEDSVEVEDTYLGHDATKTNAKAATCEAPGNITYYTCVRCGKHFSNAAGTKELTNNSWIIAMENHMYGTPTYAWDGNQCTATRVCQTNPSHIEKEVVIGRYVVDSNADCINNEMGHYEAAFTNSAFVTQCTLSVPNLNTSLGHNFIGTLTPGSFTGAGYKNTECDRCHKVEKETIPKATFAISKAAVVYNGKTQTPKYVTNLTADDYTITWNGNLKDVGTYKGTIELKGDYLGTKTVTYTVNPKATKLSSVKAAKKAITVKWTALTTKMSKAAIGGYEIQYGKKSSFSGAKKVTVKGASKKTTTIKKLTSKKKYYVRIRTFMKVNGKTLYSAWSSSKNVKVK